MNWRHSASATGLLVVSLTGCLPGGSFVLRAQTQQLRSRYDIPARVAAADAPSGRTIPPVATVQPAKRELARPAWRKPWSARQQPPGDLDGRRASVAVAS